MLDTAKVTELMSVVNIIDVAAKMGVVCKKAGKNYVSLSPFQNEKTPSCFYNVEKNVFNCFSSGKNGDVIDFVKEMEGVDYVGALLFLGNLYDISLEDLTDKESEKKRSLQNLFTTLTREFVRCLKENPLALNYAKERFSVEMIKKFQIGYIPGDFSKEKLRSAGLSEMMRNRLVFPVFNLAGKVITFQCRRLDGEKKTKYLHGANSLLFTKEKTLYGMNFARKEIHRKGYGILVEGNPDVVSLHGAGLENTVCGMGTSVSESQVKEALRVSRDWIIIFDGDNSGQKAMKTVVCHFLKAGVSPTVAILPENHDPDSYVREEEDFEDLVEISGLYFLKQNHPNEFYDVIDLYLNGIKNVHERNIVALELCQSLGISLRSILPPLRKETILTTIDDTSKIERWSKINFDGII